MPRNLDYKADLIAELRSDLDYAAKYLSAARDDSDVSFRIALRDVIEARMGMKKAAKAANINRENLYRALSSRGNPSSATIDAVLNVLGFGVRYISRTRATGSIPRNPVLSPAAPFGAKIRLKRKSERSHPSDRNLR